MEGDPDTDGDGFPDQYFYPRPPGGGRRFIYADTDSLHLDISIHALRVEGDCAAMVLCWSRVIIFLSTPSGWRATGGILSQGSAIVGISIHALRVEGDHA